jgi:hypothetical protein
MMPARAACASADLDPRIDPTPRTDSLLWMMPAALLLASLLAALYGIGDSRTRLTTVALGGAALAVAACLAIGKLMAQYYAARVLVAGAAVQLLALTAISAVGLPLSPPYHPFEVNAADAPFRVVLAMLTVPIGALIAAAVWSCVPRLRTETDTAEEIARQRRPYLIIGAIVTLLFWPAGLENAGAAGYFVRILASALLVAPFLGGRDCRRDGWLAMLWCVAILINAVIGIVAGARSKALIAVVLFAVGYISVLPRRRQAAAWICAIIAIVPLVRFVGAVGVARDELGRGGLEVVQFDHMREMFDRTFREMMPGDKAIGDDLALQGVSRFLAWSNVVVPLMTPEAIPYRGLEEFPDEARQTFRIASMSGLTPEDLFDAGLYTAPARQYGFTVNANTSVEFSVAADAWSRGGVGVALLFGFVAALGLTFGELCAYRLHRFPAGVGTILFLPIAKIAFFDANAVPLLPMLRGMVFEMVLLACVVSAGEFVRHSSRLFGRRRPGSGATRVRVG